MHRYAYLQGSPPEPQGLTYIVPMMQLYLLRERH